MPGTKKTDDRVAVGERVIEWRSEGKSFAAIAKMIGVKRSVDAFGEYVDAINRRPKSARAQLRADESSRLDALEQRTRRRSSGDELDRKLASLAKLRARLAAS